MALAFLVLGIEDAEGRWDRMAYANKSEGDMDLVLVVRFVEKAVGILDTRDKDAVESEVGGGILARTLRN